MVKAFLFMIFLASLNSFGEAVSHLVGFAFVLIILTCLWLFTALVGTYFKRADAKKAASKTVVAKTSTVPAKHLKGPDTNDITEEEVASITACIMMVMGKNSRIVSIRSGNASWSQEGRRDHFASHRIR